MHKRSPEITDYMRYVEYEIQLDRLRRLRKKELGKCNCLCGSDKAGIRRKNAQSDHAGVKRVFFIFDRAVKRFPGDVKLWLQYVEFCKMSKSYRAVGRVFGRYVG